MDSWSVCAVDLGVVLFVPDELGDARGSLFERAFRGRRLVMKRSGLRKKRVLIGTDEFSSVFCFGQRIYGKLAQLVLRCRPGDAPGRLGVVATRRTLPRAVDRNLWRRAARQVFYTDKLAICFDYIIVARSPAESVAQARNELQRLEGIAYSKGILWIRRD